MIRLWQRFGAARRDGSTCMTAVFFVLGLTLGWPLTGRGASADIVISHAKLISPPSTVIENATVVITDGKINYAGASQKRAVTAKRVIDARGRAVIPGLIDTHVHLNIDAVESQALYDEWIHRRAPAQLHEYLKHGFTTIQSLADYWPGVLEVREQIRSGKINGPRLLVAGPMITPPYGHAAAYSPKCATVPFCLQSGWYREVGDEAQALALIRDLAARHADGVKIANEPTTSPQGKPVGFAPGVLHALIDEAHAHQLRVYVHPGSADYAIEAIQAGADALAHGPGIEFFQATTLPAADAVMDRLVEVAWQRHTPISTTVVGWGVDYLKPQRAAAVLQHVKNLFDKGIPLAFGTDNIGTVESMREFEWLSRSGLTPMQILQIATLNAARDLGRENEIGSLEPGKIADLTIVAVDPLRSSAFLDRIDMVIKDGMVVFDYYAEAAQSELTSKQSGVK
jgi:imidazolonepropionase-like amidohydrolase